jgi:hypothetical protein
VAVPSLSDVLNPCRWWHPYLFFGLPCLQINKQHRGSPRSPQEELTGNWTMDQFAGYSGTVLFEWNYSPNGLTTMGCGMPRNGVARHNTFQPPRPSPLPRPPRPAGHRRDEPLRRLIGLLSREENPRRQYFPLHHRLLLYVRFCTTIQLHKQWQPRPSHPFHQLPSLPFPISTDTKRRLPNRQGNSPLDDCCDKKNSTGWV